MEAGLELRPQPDVDWTRRRYRDLYEVAEVPFVRAGSQCHSNRIPPPYLPPPSPKPWQSHIGGNPRGITEGGMSPKGGWALRPMVIQPTSKNV